MTHYTSTPLQRRVDLLWRVFRSYSLSAAYDCEDTACQARLARMYDAYEYWVRINYGVKR